FRAFYALPVDSFVTPDGQHTNAIHGFISMFLGLLKKENPTHVAVAFDISRFSFRTRIYPEYKGTRGETPAEFIGQVPLLQEALHAMGVVTVQKEDFEADDILATLATTGSAEGFDVLVVSGDRDTFQLVNERVTVLYPSARGVSELKRYTPAAVEERYGVKPHQYPEIAALVGETSDNLIGIDKVGEKTAVKWIRQFGSLDAVLEAADEIPGVVGNNLREQRERAVLNRQLNHLLTDVDLGVSLAQLERGTMDAGAIQEVFGRLAFRTLKDRVLALAGGTSAPAPVENVLAPALDLPAERTLVDEELASWLHKREGLALGVSVSSAGGETVIGLADHDVCLRVPVTGGSRDHQPVIDALANLRHRFVYFHSKLALMALAQSNIETLAPSGDVVLASWLTHPAGKSPTLAGLVQQELGIHLPEAPSDQLVPEDPPVGVGVEAWCALRLWTPLVERLESGTRSVLETIELPLAKVLADMETRGIGSDRDQLDQLEQELGATVSTHEAAAFAAIGHEVNLGSPKQLQGVLFDELGMPKTRATKTGYTTDAQALSELQMSNPHPFLGALLAHRDATKLRQIVEGLRQAVQSDGRIHTTFDQTGTSTGRLSSLDPNLQNIPVRTEMGHKIRATFVAKSPATGLLTADYSQIEMRIMAHLSGDEGLIEAFHKGEDLHRFVGARIFDVSPGEVTPEMRTKVKAMSYGLAYGLSAFGLAKQLSIPTSEAKSLMTGYFNRFGKVRDYLRSVVEQAKEDGYTETIFGRRRPFPELSSPNRMVREGAERAALNAPIQGTAADIIKRAMIAIEADLHEQNLNSRMVLQVHDELVFDVAPGEQAQLEALVTQHMGSAAELAVPLDVQIGVGSQWDEAAH
ncbi:DNA polymerase I, partial [Pontimonas sp.]